MAEGAKRPWYSPVVLLHRALIYLAVAYLTLCVYLYFSQDSQIYPAALSGGLIEKTRAMREAAAEGLVAWPETNANSAQFEGFVPKDFTAPAARGTVVVFHGNGGWAVDRTLYVDAFRPRGFRTFLYEYPGYGGRPGHPREAAIVADARKLIDRLDAAGDGPVYVWGESLGSGVAASVVADPTLPVHGLTLMMPWDTIANVALYRFPFIPVRFLLHDTYNSMANLAHFHHPVCVIRGDQDTTIPPVLTLNLFAHLAPPKLMILEKGYGHGDWPSESNLGWWDEALNFIAPAAKK